MNPNRTYEENMAALKKVLTQRTYTALSHRNIEFVLKYQNASLQELAAYLRRRQAELRHIPGRTEIIGGDFIELRFRGWVNALEAIGVSRELAAKRGTPALEKTALFQAEFNTQRELDKAAKAEAKRKTKAKRSHRFKAKAADSARIFFWMRKSLEERCTRLNCKGSNARRIRTCGKRRSSKPSTSGSSQSSGRSRRQKRKPNAQHGKPNDRNRLRRKAHNNSFAQSELGTDLHIDLISSP